MSLETLYREIREMALRHKVTIVTTPTLLDSFSREQPDLPLHLTCYKVPPQTPATMQILKPR